MIRERKEIDKRGLDRATLETIRESLTLANPAWDKAMKRGQEPKGSPYLVLYKEDKDCLLVPRHFGLSRFPLTDKRYTDRPITWPATNWMPRPHQVAPLQALCENKEGVVVLPCGSGKTVLTLLYLAWRGQRALAIAPSETVRDQWCEYFEVMFPEGMSHIVGGKNWRTDSPLSAATLQLIALYPPPPEFFQQFGVVIFDEVDMANAAQLSQALTMFNTERIGLTATKTRDDKMDVLSDLHIGPTIHCQEDVPEALRAKIHIVKTKIWMHPKANLPREITRVSMREDKMNRVFQTIHSALAHKRKLFVLCERIEQAEMYHAHALAQGIDCTLAHSKTKKETRDYSRQVIFATNLIGRGFNCEELDTLLVTGIFIYSAREFKQLLGRLQRPAEKRRPTVVIYLDDHSDLAGHLYHILAKTRNYYLSIEYSKDSGRAA